MLDIDELTSSTDDKMTDSLAAFERDLAGFRTGKASPSVVEGIMVDYYGSQTRLRDIAGISTPEPRCLAVQPWDASALPAIEKAIIASNVGISPVNDGRVIRLPVPELSEERRKSLCKEIHKRAEDAKVEVRNHRRDANDRAKKAHKDHNLTDDFYHDCQDEVQKLTDDYIKKIDDLMTRKEAEVMQV